MTQFTFGTINTDTTDGTDLANDLESFEGAVQGANGGTSAPSYAIAGTIWRDTTGTPWILKMFDGTDWVPFASFNATSNTWQPYQGTSALKFTPYAADSGSANAYTIAPSPSIDSYVTGLMIFLKPSNANTGASTINVNGKGTKNIKMPDGNDPTAGSLLTTNMYILVYDGTNFIITGIQNIKYVLPFSADSGTATAYAVAPSPSITGYTSGQIVFLKPANANTGACTLNVNGKGAKNIKTSEGNDPPAGFFSVTSITPLIYDGTNFIIMGGAKLDKVQTWTKPQRGNIQTVTITDGAAAVDLALSNNFHIDVTGNFTLSNPTNQVAGQSGIITFKMDATGGYTITYDTNWLFVNSNELQLGNGANAWSAIPYYVAASGVILCGLGRSYG